MNIFIIDRKCYHIGDTILDAANSHPDALSINYCGKYSELISYWINFYPSGYVISPNKMINDAIQIQ